METLWMSPDGFAFLVGFIALAVVLGLGSAVVESAWERWKLRKSKGV